jgi:hypothetical protein
MAEGTSFFILGNPRSGTSLLRLMLDAHAKIVVPPESGFLLWWHEKYATWSWQDSKNPDRVARYITDLRSSKKIETWGLDFERLQQMISESLPHNYAGLSSLVYYAYGSAKHKSVTAWGDKNNYYLRHVAQLNDIYPNAYFIHLVRDGRDVACSYLGLKDLKTTSPYRPVLPTSIEDISAEWVKNNAIIETALNRIDSRRRVLAKYEEVVAATERTLRTICSSMNLDFDPAMLNYYQTNREPDATIDWKTKTLERPDESNFNKYKSILDKASIAKFNQIAESTLVKYGYES